MIDPSNEIDGVSMQRAGKKKRKTADTASLPGSTAKKKKTTEETDPDAGSTLGTLETSSSTLTTPQLAKGRKVSAQKAKVKDGKEKEDPPAHPSVDVAKSGHADEAKESTGPSSLCEVQEYLGESMGTTWLRR